MALSGTAASALIHSNRPEIKLPYEMNFRKQANFILHVDDQSEAFMQQLSAQIICNYLRAFPVSKGRVVAIDCKKAGGNTVAFQAFSLKFPEKPCCTDCKLGNKIQRWRKSYFGL